jgi:hypothetical protein
VDVRAHDLDRGIGRDGDVAAIGLGYYFFSSGGSAWNARNAPVATFVGSETCTRCHQSQAKLWHGSHHERAMDHATEKSGPRSMERFSVVTQGGRANDGAFRIGGRGGAARAACCPPQTSGTISDCRNNESSKPNYADRTEFGIA